MGVATGILIYFLWWWVVIFAVLPWRVRTDPENCEPGFASSAPKNPQILIKWIVAAVIAGIFWLITYMLLKYNVIILDEYIHNNNNI